MEQGFQLRSVFNAEVINKIADDIKNYIDFKYENLEDSINSKHDNPQFGEQSELTT
jgi:hypothetical protein